MSTIEHDHPHKSVAIHKLFFDPLSIGINLRHWEILVIKPLSRYLQIFQGHINVSRQNLFVMTTTRDCVIANLLLRNPRPFGHNSPLNGPSPTVTTSIHPLITRLSNGDPLKLACWFPALLRYAWKVLIIARLEALERLSDFVISR